MYDNGGHCMEKWLTVRSLSECSETSDRGSYLVGHPFLEPGRDHQNAVT